jgi:hypothetical protein
VDRREGLQTTQGYESVITDVAVKVHELMKKVRQAVMGGDLRLAKSESIADCGWSEAQY